MKSIVEEASSLEKAITSAWSRAGKPKKFTITVFQEPEKNFFGMTTSPAKIGFLYEERSVTQSTQKRGHTNKTQRASHSNQAGQTAQSSRPTRSNQTPQKQTPSRHPQPQARPQATPQAQANQEQTNSNRFWSQEMIDAADKWLNDTLKMIDKQSITFSSKPNRYHLKVQFSQPISPDAKKEKSIFRSFAHLIMQAQRSHFKKALKHHKVILMSN